MKLAAYQIEGNLIGFDLTTEIISGDFKGQTSPDFKLEKSQKLEDEIAIRRSLALRDRLGLC